MKESHRIALEKLPIWDELVEMGTTQFYPTHDDAANAAQELGIKTGDEYFKRYKEDPRLPSCPDKVYEGKGWVSWPFFLTGKQAFYPTHDDAANAAQELGIRTGGEYRKRYKEDPRLPSNPNVSYEGKGWVSWHLFLNKKDIYSYEEAAKVARELGIGTCDEYFKRYKEDPRLPSWPNEVYDGKGWVSWPFFLNNKNIYSHDDAARVAKKLGIGTSQEYLKRYKEDLRLPSSPYKTYEGKGWVSWPFFLLGKAFYSYEDAERAARKLGIRTGEEYRKRYKEDPRLPAQPRATYKSKGWVSWPFFLTGKDKEDFYSYDDAEKAARRLGIRTCEEYQKKHKQDPRLPFNPNISYEGKGWVSWPLFLNKEDKYYSYEEAAKVARELGIGTCDEYFKKYKEDPRLPSWPNTMYFGKGWVSWPFFLTGKQRNFYSYQEAAKVARKLGIRTDDEYFKRYKEDLRLPSSPYATYKGKGWVSWPLFLTGKDKEDFYSYQEAARIARKLGIRTAKEYSKKCKQNSRLPATPHKVYDGKGWVSWHFFLTGKNKKDPYSYQEAVRVARKLGIGTGDEYFNRYKEDPRLPSAPHQCYKGKGWISWSFFLAGEDKEDFYSYKEAATAVKKLGIVKTVEYIRRYKEDPRLPSNPNITYKGKGWVSFPRYLGKVV